MADIDTGFSMRTTETDVTCVWTTCTIAAPHEHRGYSPIGTIPPRVADNRD